MGKGPCLVPRRLSENVRAKEGGKETTGYVGYYLWRLYILASVLETWNNVNLSSKVQLLCPNETSCTVTIQKKLILQFFNFTGTQRFICFFNIL